MKRKIAIVGGGAAGLFCSIYLKQVLKDEVEIFLLEKEDRVGKKILASGSGKCNLSNLNMDAKYYNTSQVAYALRCLSPEKLLEIFASWGLYTRSDEEGRLYPYSEKATSVLDVLHKKLEELGIKPIQFEVSHIKKLKHFLVYSKTYQLLNVDVVVLASGGLATYMKSNVYDIAKSLGHSIEPLAPGLVAIKTKDNFKALSGLRVKTLAKILDNNKVLWQGEGEILFRDDGISGILAFDLSRYLSKSNLISLDLVYNLSDESLNNFLANNPDKLFGLLAKMLAQEVKNRFLKDTKKGLIWYLRNFLIHASGTYTYQNAQITLGGVSINEVNPTSFESTKLDKLYIIGELLDVDAASGGYNLHFAWSSAYLCALSIIKMIQGENSEKTKST